MGWKFIKSASDGYPVYARENADRDRTNPPPQKPRTLKPQPPTPLPPFAITLARLGKPPTHPQKRKWENPTPIEERIVRETAKKKKLPLEDFLRNCKTIIEYPYSSTQWTKRIEYSDPEKAKGYSKATRPCYLNGDTEKIGKGDRSWDAYRLSEILEHGADQWVLGVEGEPCVEAARYLGLAAFTFQGGSWTLGDIERFVLTCKEAGIKGIAYLPDNDDAGFKKSAQLYKICAQAQFPFLSLNPSALWEECPDNGDIADWIKWGMEQGWDKEEFIKRLEENLKYSAISQKQAEDERRWLSTQYKNNVVTGDSRLVSDSRNTDTVTIPTTVTTVTEILKSGFPDWEEINKLEALRVNSELNNKQAFYALVNGIKSQFDEVQPEDEIRLKALIDWHNTELDFHSCLPSMAADILHDAKILNIDPIGIWQYLFPAVLSLTGKRVDLDVYSHTIPAIAWTALLAESGAGKTRAEKLVTTPLKQLQKAARERFKAELEEWSNWEGKDGEKKPPLPVERKYMYEVATIQAVMRRQSEQGKNGALWARDELAGIFQSFGQFSRNGESEALSCLLTTWDGGSTQVDRVSQDDSYFTESSRLSIAGGIQPGVFKKVFKDPNDAQGLQARFLFAAMKPQKPKRVKGFCHLSEKLPRMYQWLGNLPEGKIKLSKAADTYYDLLYELIGEQAFSTSMPAIRAWMFKLPAQLLRIALALHLIECYHEPNRPFWELQKETLERAVLFAQYYRSAFHIIQTTAADTDDISAILMQIWDKAITRHPDGISNRDAYREIKAIQYRAKDVGRSVSAYTVDLFTKLEQMGKGTVVKKGRQIKFAATLNPPPIPPDNGGLLPKTDPPGDRVTEAETVVTTGNTTVTENEVSPVTVTKNGDSVKDDDEVVGEVIAPPAVEIQEDAIAPSVGVVQEDAILPTPTPLENPTELHGWDELHSYRLYPNPKSNSINTSQQRALKIREAVRAAGTKEDLSALRRENGGDFSVDELLWVQNWLKNFFPAEYKHLMRTRHITQPSLLD